MFRGTKISNIVARLAIVSRVALSGHRGARSRSTNNLSCFRRRRFTAARALRERHRVANECEEFEKLGYTVIDGYTAVKDPDRTRFVYRELLWRGADMIGVGNSAIGHLGGAHYQNEASFDGYLEKIENDRLPVWRTLQLNRQELLIRELILQLKFGQVSREYFQKKFDVDIRSHFAKPIVRLQETGLLEARGGDLTLTREGLLRVDGLLPQFFLPQHLS